MFPPDPDQQLPEQLRDSGGRRVHSRDELGHHPEPGVDAAVLDAQGHLTVHLRVGCKIAAAL